MIGAGDHLEAFIHGLTMFECTQPEILQALQEQAQVDPEFTSVVWQKLEEQNPSFFRAYNVQLQLKEQILAFNYLVRVHVKSRLV